VNPGPIAALAKSWQQDDADAQQAALDAVRAVFQTYVMIPALKAAIAHHAKDEDWLRLRPPLVELNAAQRAELMSKLEAAGFGMPGLKRAA
jgi:4-hydroxy-tetrahydrodipicolinate synthase